MESLQSHGIHYKIVVPIDLSLVTNRQSYFFIAKKKNKTKNAYACGIYLVSM